jgi:hypothetical protein
MRAFQVVALALLGLTGVAPPLTHAQTALPLELTWRAPAPCPQAAELQAELARIARVQPGFALAPLAARGEVEEHAGHYSVRLQTVYEGETGERILEGDDCHTLTRSVTLVIALAFGPGVQVTPNAPVNVPLPVPVPAPAPAPITQPEAPPPNALRVALLANAGAQLALLPSAALALALGAELASGPWSVELHAGFWPSVEKDVAPDARASFDGLFADVIGCREVTRSALRAQLCAGARGAAVRGHSSGALDTGSSVAPWYAALLGGQLSWPSSARFRLRVEARLALSLHRPLFRIENLPRTHRVPLFVPDFGAGVSFDL